VPDPARAAGAGRTPTMDKRAAGPGISPRPGGPGDRHGHEAL